MAQLVGHRVVGVVVVLLEIGIEFSTGISMGNRNLNGFTIQLFRIADRPLDGLLGFSRQVPQ